MREGFLIAFKTSLSVVCFLSFLWENASSLHIRANLANTSRSIQKMKMTSTEPARFLRQQFDKPKDNKVLSMALL
jgi:hypothetical protein